MRTSKPWYVLGRIGQAVLVLWAAYTVCYIILNLLPADPLALLLQAKGTDIGSLNADQIATLRHTYGLDAGPVQQYLTMLLAALHGDFGTSYTLGQPVLPLIASRVSSTLAISLLALVVAVALAFALAFAAVFTRSRVIRNVLGAIPVIGMSVPSFWVALLLMQVFSFSLGWFPSMGMQGWKSLVLPTVTMAIPTSALLGQLLLSEFDAVLESPQAVVAKAHGLSRTQVILHHVVKNASLPSLTILGLLVGDTFTGAIIAETIFARQGLGMLIQQAVTQQDVPVVQGAVVLAAGAFVLVNLIVDLIYPLLDPRIRI
ncbi:ABC transporter permease [Bifidobacterium aesculapii]|uniref:ABC transporter permease n=1 Tax=Bifidobacterium aesculapii TaxID=1329411 RepID=UPI0006E35BAC|nr:ABC transporter permease [Bifidobacterium aesculapii]